MSNLLEFTEDNLPRELLQSEVVAAHVRQVFDGKTPVRIMDVARDLDMHYGTCKTHLHRAAKMGLLKLVMRKGFVPADGPRRKVKWR